MYARITKILGKGRHRFEVINEKETLTCFCPYSLPLAEGDSIYFEGTPEAYKFRGRVCKQMKITTPPFVYPGTDEDSVFRDATIALGRKPTVLYHIERDATSIDHHAIVFHEYKTCKYVVPPQYEEDLKILLKWWYRRRCLRRLYLLGVTKTEINNSGYDVNELYNICLENPYRVLSFTPEKCQEIIQRTRNKVGSHEIECGHKARIIAKKLDSKVTYLSQKSLNFDIPDDLDKYGIQISEKFVAVERIIKIEENVASLLIDFVAIQEDIPEIDIPEIDEDQKDAFIGALRNKVCIITGSAGTGKTTLIRYLVKYLGVKACLLTSFTGKAVARLKEVIPESNPETLHRVICSEQRETEYLIIDEASMIETELFHKFMSFVKTSHIVFVGDLNQLTPIGWGCFFQQISGKIPTFTLKTNHRSQSGIITNSQLLLEGKFFEEKEDFHFAFYKKPLDIIKEKKLDVKETRVITPFTNTAEETNVELQKYYSQGQEGIEYKERKFYLHDRVMMTKNNYTLEIMNGQEGFITSFEERGVNVSFNGHLHLFIFQQENIDKILALYPPARRKYLDLDTLMEVTPSKKKEYSDDKLRLTSDDEILLENVRAFIEEKDSPKFPPIDHLILSYSLTVHKAQGSEWDHVIVYLPRDSSFITRNLIYTAITRARKHVYLLGSESIFRNAGKRTEKEPQQLLSRYLEFLK